MTTLQQAPQILTDVDELIQSKIKAGALRREFDIKNKRIADALEEFMTRGGKSLRGAYVYVSAMSTGYIKDPIDFRKPNQDILRFLPVALSIQFDHNWFLIHDDKEDDSLWRRGKPTLHIMHGEDLAMNYGDFLHALAQKSMIKGLPLWKPEIFSRMTKARVEMVETTCFGQNYEFEKRRVPINQTTRKDVIEI